MILVIDANVLFSALIKCGTTRNILLLSGYDFYAPEFSIQEFEKHLSELRKKTGLNNEELNTILKELLDASEITLVPFEEFKNQKELAKNISPDPDDVAYIALALHLGCPLWSNDKALKKQSKVKVITTSEMSKKINKELVKKEIN